MTRSPVVSVVVPMLDELDSIGECLDGFAAQTYSLERLDVVVVDGGSTDGSRELVARRASEVDWIRLVDNPRRRASAAFNIGVSVARGEVVCLFSAHGVPDPTYVAQSVAVLHETGADGVGGRYRHVGTDPVSKAIGMAMVSPVGMASPHRFAHRRCEADTISHPAYRAAALDRVGPFDEELLRNSDYELNWRLREQGGRLVFDPGIVSVYRPRRSLTALARQFWWYGRWKMRVARRHPRSIKPRHVTPPVAVAVASISPILMGHRRGRVAMMVAGLIYAALIVFATARARPRAHRASLTAFVACFPIMHGSWGAGFLASVLGDAMASNSSCTSRLPSDGAVSK